VGGMELVFSAVTKEPSTGADRRPLPRDRHEPTPSRRICATTVPRLSTGSPRALFSASCGDQATLRLVSFNVGVVVDCPAQPCAILMDVHMYYDVFFHSRTDVGLSLTCIGS
jgi:hypothetical protein